MLNLPSEVQSNVLGFLRAQDITRFGRTCRTAYQFISADNVLLWRSAFLQEFDDPADRWSLEPGDKESGDQSGLKNGGNWYLMLRKRLAAFRKIRNQSDSFTHIDDDDVAETLLDIIDTAGGYQEEHLNAKAGSRVEYRKSKNMARLTDRQVYNDLFRFIDKYEGRVLNSASAESSPSAIHGHFTRSVARLERPYRSDEIGRFHVLFGLTDAEEQFGKGKAAARRLVYDMSMTSAASDYGPFHLDGSGRVNWQLLEALCVVIGRNVKQCSIGLVTLPQGISYSLPHLTRPNPILHDDWAGVTGSWFGTYCFLEYQDLLNYNIGYQGGIRPSLEGQIEACGDLMKLDLRIDTSQRILNDWRLTTTLPERGDPPPLFFAGFSMSHGDPAHPRILVRGRVSVLPSGKEVRWRYIIR